MYILGFLKEMIPIILFVVFVKVIVFAIFKLFSRDNIKKFALNMLVLIGALCVCLLLLGNHDGYAMGNIFKMFWFIIIASVIEMIIFKNLYKDKTGKIDSGRNLKYIGNAGFSGNDNLEFVSFERNRTVRFGKGVFYNCNLLNNS